MTDTVIESRPPAEPGRGPSRRPRRRFWRTGLAAAGGLALFVAFPEWHVWPLAVAGPAALALAVRGERLRSGLWLGLVFGLAFLTPLLKWVGVYVGAFPWLALSVYQSLFYLLLGGALAVVSRSRWWPLWGAALWVADEGARSRWLLGGFPWGRLGFSQTEGPFTSLAAYGGVPLLSFAVALTGGLLAAAIAALLAASTGARRNALRRAAAALVGAVVVPVVGAVAWLPLAGPSLTAGGPTSTVAVVQGNVPRAGLDFNSQRRAVLDNHVDATIRLAEDVAAGTVRQPDMVIWPENSSDIDPYRNADAAAAISEAVQAIGVPILVGAVVDGPGRYLSNTGIVWDPVTGPGQTYVKRHPVPLGEYIPARSFFRFFSTKVDLVARDFVQGGRVGTLQIAGDRIGDVICFEVAYDGLLSDVLDAGAGMIVVQTNNATFGYTHESAQQLAMSQVRAVEYGRTVVVSSTSGISAIVAPDGSLAQRSSLFTSDLFVQDIAQRDQRTVAERLGAWPEYVLAALGVGALLMPVARRRRVRPGSGTAQPTAGAI